jgi:hypothetical protein
MTADEGGLNDSDIGKNHFTPGRIRPKKNNRGNSNMPTTSPSDLQHGSMPTRMSKDTENYDDKHLMPMVKIKQGKRSRSPISNAQNSKMQ